MSALITDNETREDLRRIEKVNGAQNPSAQSTEFPLNALVSMWYVAPGCLPVRLQGQMTTARFYVGNYGLPLSRVFERERDALQLSLKEKKAAREMWEQEYDALTNRIDEEVADETVNQ